MASIRAMGEKKLTLERPLHPGVQLGVADLQLKECIISETTSVEFSCLLTDLP